MLGLRSRHSRSVMTGTWSGRDDCGALRWAGSATGEFLRITRSLEIEDRSGPTRGFRYDDRWEGKGRERAVVRSSENALGSIPFTWGVGYFNLSLVTLLPMTWISGQVVGSRL
jgi:hypothetical protein